MFKRVKPVLGTLIVSLLGLPFGLAQSESLLGTTLWSRSGETPAHMWELGVHQGVPLAFGDLKFMPGYGGGFHVRRALDYVFSVRGEAFFGILRNKNAFDGQTKTTWNGGTFEIIASLNSLVWSARKSKKTNLYGLIGAGLNAFEVEVVNAISSDVKPKDYNLQSHGGLGLGVSVRLNERLNIGLETKAWILFGHDNDRLDAVERQEGDVLSYSSLRLNINLGDKKVKSEPLYWVNPMGVLLRDITELKSRPALDTTDTDQDGVIDLLDQDNNTPPGIPVDTRGLALDSDGDGIPNHEDPFPFFSSDRAIAELMKADPAATEADVERIIQQRLGEYDRTGRVLQPGNENKGGADPMPDVLVNRAASSNETGLTDWLLPLIHFEIDGFHVRYADYGSLSGIAKMMKENQHLRLVVTGFTDKTASTVYNNSLSYQRAKATIDHLVVTHGIDRSRLVLQYNGENDPLVPSTGSNLMNRRVEFRIATDRDLNMSAPVPVSNKKRKKGRN